MSVKTLVTLPRSLVKFHLRGPLAGLGVTTLLVPLLGDMPNLIRGQAHFSLLDWRFGLWMWALSVVLLAIYFLIRHQVKRAIAFYLLVALAGVPGMAVILVGGLRAFEADLGEGALRWLLVGLLAGLATLPWIIRARRAWFRKALETGHLSESLDRGTAQWDPRQDNRYLEEDSHFTRPGCLMRLLPWVGPAIGASLGDIFGHATTLTIITLLSTGLGYSLLFYKLRYVFTNVPELRRLERELGRPILLLGDQDFQRKSKPGEK